jgi:hypothetical protein
LNGFVRKVSYGEGVESGDEVGTLKEALEALEIACMEL